VHGIAISPGDGESRRKKELMSQGHLKSTYEQSSVHERWKAAYRGNPLLDRLNAAMLDRMFAATRLGPGARVLDPGCGDATHTIAIAQRGYDCTGVDISETILEAARANISAAGLSDRARVVCSSLEELAFPNESFDLIHCRGVLMHIPRWKDALAQLVRVARPGGHLVLFEGNTQALETSLVRALRWLRKPASRIQDEPGGVESWAVLQGQPFVVRVARIAYMQRQLADWGLMSKHRWASEFWDVYRFPKGGVRNTIIRFNSAWFRLRLPARWSSGNILIVRKQA
jgi:2-polyprenyl-3-methyl-5-hydroxy-6-metoxy-1,4-benzoquinol methylase